MLRYLQKLARLLRGKNHNKKEDPSGGEEASRELLGKLAANLRAIRDEFGESCDLIIREFTFGRDGAYQAALIFIDGMVSTNLINDDVIKPLMYDIRLTHAGEAPELAGIDDIRETLLSVGDVRTVRNFCDAMEDCLSGDAVLLVDGFAAALAISAKGWEKRAISEPNTETVVRGPREGFTENLRTNTSMVRRKIQNTALRVRPMTIGQRTRTRINILYIAGLANPTLVQEVERRLRNINTDSVLAAGYLEQYIEDAPYSIFPTIWYSEKPDAIAGKLLEGRVAIIVDGTPFVLSVPMLFMENFQTSEDYAIRSYYATGLRILRLVAFAISLLAPALYVALSTFHQELVPTTLLFTMAAASEGVPFPAAAEAAVMLFAFEILREAGVRMPRPVGQAISIVGALVMGQSAVQAGLVGAPVVIAIAITAVSSFVIPLAADATALLRWLLLIMAAAMGNFGITIGVFIILIHLASLKSFSANYLAPLAPFQSADLKDSLVRIPLWMMRTRPRSLKPQDLQRQEFEIPYDATKGPESEQPGEGERP